MMKKSYLFILILITACSVSAQSNRSCASFFEVKNLDKRVHSWNLEIAQQLLDLPGIESFYPLQDGKFILILNQERLSKSGLQLLVLPDARKIGNDETFLAVVDIRKEGLHPEHWKIVGPIPRILKIIGLNPEKGELIVSLEPRASKQLDVREARNSFSATDSELVAIELKTGRFHQILDPVEWSKGFTEGRGHYPHIAGVVLGPSIFFVHPRIQSAFYSVELDGNGTRGGEIQRHHALLDLYRHNANIGTLVSVKDRSGNKLWMLARDSNNFNSILEYNPEVPSQPTQVLFPGIKAHNMTSTPEGRFVITMQQDFNSRNRTNYIHLNLIEVISKKIIGALEIEQPVSEIHQGYDFINQMVSDGMFLFIKTDAGKNIALELKNFYKASSQTSAAMSSKARFIMDLPHIINPGSFVLEAEELGRYNIFSNLDGLVLTNLKLGDRANARSELLSPAYGNSHESLHGLVLEPSAKYGVGFYDNKLIRYDFKTKTSQIDAKFGTITPYEYAVSTHSLQFVKKQIFAFQAFRFFEISSGLRSYFKNLFAFEKLHDDFVPEASVESISYPFNGAVRTALVLEGNSVLASLEMVIFEFFL